MTSVRSGRAVPCRAGALRCVARIYVVGYLPALLVGTYVPAYLLGHPNRVGLVECDDVFRDSSSCLLVCLFLFPLNLNVKLGIKWAAVLHRTRLICMVDQGLSEILGFVKRHTVPRLYIPR